MRDKRVLLGRRILDDKRVVIKASNSPTGKAEIANEKAAQDTLSKVVFSQESIFFPVELYYGTQGEYLCRITEFITQEQVFGAYPLEDQFFMIMREFETQESFYANTFEHINIVKGIFPVTHAKDYIRNFQNFEFDKDKSEALRLLTENENLIETRSNYLTHTDFAPSNFRVTHKKVYMIDLSSMHFANRYEGLARFLNYCITHNPNLEKAIVKYIRINRSDEEYLCLRLMRIYKAGFLLHHHTKTAKKTHGDLHDLSLRRVELWNQIMDNLITNTPVDPTLIEQYKAERNKLRSEKEVERQKEFNII